MRASSARGRVVFGGLGLVVVFLALGCDLPLFTATETVSEVYTTGAAPKIVVETFNGSVDISDGADDEVVVEVTGRASGFDQRTADDNLKHVEITLVQQGNEIRVVARRVGSTFGNVGADVVIAAPRQALLDLKSSNGYIVSEGMRGDIVAKTSNAKVGVYEAAGRLDVGTSNAAIDIEAAGSVVDASTSNGSIRFSGELADARHRLRTSNARIAVTLPADSEFRFDASTSNSRIDCAFDYDGDGSKRRRKVKGRVGDDPKCSLELSTSNAAIDIRKAD